MVGALGAAAGALGEAGAGAAAGLLAAAGLPAAGAEVVAGAEAAAVAVSSLSEDLLFFEPLFLVVEAVSLLAAAAGDADLLAVVLPAVSAALLFLVLLFLVLLASALAVESAGFELSAATALLLFLEVLFFAVVAESPAAALSLLAAADFFDLDLEVLLESALASVPLCDVSSAAAFFLLFFFVLVLLSVWSEEPDCSVARAARLPHTSSMAASSAKTIALLDFISHPPVLTQGCYV